MATNSGTSRIEWVPGSPWNWLLWWLALGLLVASGLAPLPFLGTSADPVTIDLFELVALTGAVALFGVMYAPTSHLVINRRIGLSEEGLLSDVGAWTSRYRWEELGWVDSRVLVHSAGPGSWSGQHVRLSETQARRVREYLDSHFPSRGTLPPWMKVYEP
jgi:hypothetical protein